MPFTAAIVEQLPEGVPGVTGSRGQTVTFHVKVTNRSARPFRFGNPCPNYVEGSGSGQPTEVHVLNCRPVGAIAAGASVVFEMRIRVPDSAPIGRDALTWALAPATYEPPSASGVLLVEG